MQARIGITLVELLAVVAIVGALVALLLPPMLAAHAAERWTQCQHNLRQSARAPLNDQGTLGYYSSSGLAFGASDQATTSR